MRKLKEGERADTGKEARKVRKTENFFSRNTKTITFIITISVFLIIFIPIATLEATNYFSDDYDGRPQMTVNDVIQLSDQRSTLAEKHFKQYAGVTTESEYEVHYKIMIDPYYFLYAVIEKQTGKVQYCTLSNLDTGHEVDVLTGDVRAFFMENE